MKIKEIVENIQTTGSNPNKQYTVKKSDASGVTLTQKNDPNGVQVTLPPQQTSALKQVKPGQFMLDKTISQTLANQPTTQSSTTQSQLPATGNVVELPDDLLAAETIEDDMMSSGKNQDIGDDASDSLITQVVDYEYERKQRPSVKMALPENDELNKWLTIAGLR